ncbi:hypothetical protein CK203_044156 [Vitis vinifera]|uniref:Retrotransposon gag domain-containing protein n=1 Tax=Vitis vinifera TaxID=29760 RepID=A0A438I2T7_VITVI|nr:hypothetical protein CK203_044156 [Vitis vinifera]
MGQLRLSDGWMVWDDFDGLLVANLSTKFRMLEIERYTGIGCPHIHLGLYSTVMRAHGFDEAHMIMLFLMSLSGAAQRWFSSLDGKKPSSAQRSGDVSAISATKPRPLRYYQTVEQTFEFITLHHLMCSTGHLFLLDPCLLHICTQLHSQFMLLMPHRGHPLIIPSLGFHLHRDQCAKCDHEPPLLAHTTHSVPLPTSDDDYEILGATSDFSIPTPFSLIPDRVSLQLTPSTPSYVGHRDMFASFILWPENVDVQVLRIPTSFNLLLGRPWIHQARAIPSSLHRKISHSDDDFFLARFTFDEDDANMDPGLEVHPRVKEMGVDDSTVDGLQHMFHHMQMDMINGVVPHDEYRDEMDMLGISQFLDAVQHEPFSPLEFFGVFVFEIVEEYQIVPTPELPLLLFLLLIFMDLSIYEYSSVSCDDVSLLAPYSPTSRYLI